MADKKIEIVNVIELINGIANAPQSFVIENEMNKDEISTLAEKLFLECAKEHGMEESEQEEALDNGSYDYHGGYEVILTWSYVLN